ncbi:uncharacterized protein LOC121244821 [Juglans microcarpa x Juglans regia]|uniref:uncharacterized protein LOC121244821 n=1 Tax=Juglans microcarpa x Juglans regia TaxID=2249226 RepID=UPI001B7ED310|nr:uncharacterized protein LOC121244821 [Juglans microcarpa x Juglans regia]
MGFCNQWIELVMNCIEAVSYAILVNGSPQESFHPTRGIRQRDPLSPYVFIICAKALSSLISKTKGEGLIHGVPIAKNRLRISQLFFADDCLLFCKANAIEWGKLFGLLRAYESASGQILNLEKTSIIFSKNTSRDTQQYILSIDGVRNGMSYEKYLGLPSVVGKNKAKTFKRILDSIRAKVSNHRVKMLSQAGNEIFIKAFIQALPTYTMSIFKLPNSLLQEINRVINNFWWGQQGNEHRIHWISWKNMGKAKTVGGMGIRDFEAFNKIILAKQCWRLIQHLDSLAAQVIVQEARIILDVLNEEGCRTSKVCTSAEVWQAPPSNWLKMNWDSAVDKARGIVGVGVVVRNSSGKIIATLRTKKHLFPNSLLAEAFGALKTVQFGWSLV